MPVGIISQIVLHKLTAMRMIQIWFVHMLVWRGANGIARRLRGQ